MGIPLEISGRWAGRECGPAVAETGRCSRFSAAWVDGAGALIGDADVRGWCAGVAAIAMAIALPSQRHRSRFD